MIFHESCVFLNTMHKRFLLKIKGNCTIFICFVLKKNHQKQIGIAKTYTVDIYLIHV